MAVKRGLSNGLTNLWNFIQNIENKALTAALSEASLKPLARILSRKRKIQNPDLN